MPVASSTLCCLFWNLIDNVYELLGHIVGNDNLHPALLLGRKFNTLSFLDLLLSLLDALFDEFGLFLCFFLCPSIKGQFPQDTGSSLFIRATRLVLDGCINQLAPTNTHHRVVLVVLGEIDVVFALGNFLPTFAAPRFGTLWWVHVPRVK